MTGRPPTYFDENKPYSGLGRASLHSGLILMAARGLNIVFQLTSVVVVSRLLSPHDFGLVATVLALITFAPLLIDMGTTEASTQKTQISHIEISTLFWLNIATSCVLMVLLAGSSGLLARVYGEPALSNIMLASSITLIFAAGSNQHQALMRRAMQFRRLAAIDIAANLISAIVGIAMAFTGWGYWALVAKPIVAAAIVAGGVWLSCPWRPGRPQVTPDVKEMVGFGLRVTGFTMTDCLARSADRLALGFFYGAGPLGYYHNAYLVYTNLLGIIAEPLHNIGVASLSKLRNENGELKRSWATALSSVSFFSAAAFAGLAVSGQDFILILLGPKWAAAGPLLCIFAVRGIAQVVERTLGWLHMSLGRSDRWMRWGIFSATCQLAFLAAGLPFGFIGVATAYTVVMFFLFVPALAYAGAPAGISTRDVLAAVGPQTAGALLTVAVGWTIQWLFLGDLHQLLRFCVSVAICLSTYLAIVVGIFRVTAPLRLAWNTLQGVRPAWSRGTLQPADK